MLLHSGKISSTILIAKRQLGKFSVINRLWSVWNQKLDFRHLLDVANVSLPINHVVVWDQLTSPPTIGDLIEVIMFARWIASQGRKVTFVVITGSYREDWNRTEYVELDRVQQQIIEALSIKLNITVKRCSWQEFLKLTIDDQNCHVLFSYRVKRRKSVYSESLYLLNRLVTRSRQVSDHDWLLDSHELSKTIMGKSEVLKSGKYVAWGVRYRSLEPERNTGESEFRLLYLGLKNRSNGLPIVVVSDKEACEYFRKIAQSFNLECLFSSDYSTSFLDDAAIAIGGEVFFLIRGGGMGEVALYSSAPYEMSYAISPTRKMFSKQKMTAWQTSEQVFSKLPADDLSLHLPQFEL